MTKSTSPAKSWSTERRRNWWAEKRKDPEYVKQLYKRQNASRVKKRKLLAISNPSVNEKLGSGICAYRDCEQKLSMYNDTNFCNRHYRIMFNRGFIKDKDLM